MPDATINNRITIAGVPFTETATVAYDGPQGKEKSGSSALAAAKVGQLTTRTDNETGTLTMESGHGITTAAVIDLFWDGGCRRGILVGTVATNSVPIGADNAGSGDNLPTNLTAITAFVRLEEEFLVTGDNIQCIGAKMSRKGAITFADAADVELFAIVDPFDSASGGGYQWYTGNGITNPLAGEDVAKVFFSNGDSGGANTALVYTGNN